MRSEIISVGTEILIGDIVDTNSEYISRRLAELGVNCYYHTTVGDNEKRLKNTFKSALNRSNVIIFTGGLGPTYDDMTKEVVAEILDLEMVYDKETYQRIQEIFEKSSRKLTDNNRKQAFIPKGAKILTNYNGTAPGILIEHDEKIVILLPGPPHELKEMFEGWLVPYFSKLTDQTIVSHRVYLFGIGESYIEEILREDMVNYTNPTIAPYARDGNIFLRITASAETEKKANELIKPVVKHVKNIFKDYVYSVDIETIEEALILKLKEQNKVLASAESCTGGYLSKRLTDISGSSEVFELGLITYSDKIKHEILNVNKDILKEHGAVSKETVEAMSENLLEISKADIVVSISGIAGPTGGTKEKPVGLVYINVMTHNTSTTKELMLSRGYDNERERIRLLSTSHALKLILDTLNQVNA